MSKGLGTCNDRRFVRLWWEVNHKSPRWFLFSKGGRYSRWQGLEYFVVDYENNGERLCKELNQKFPYLKGNFGLLIHDPELFNKPGLVYSEVGRGSLGVRLKDSATVVGHRGPGVFPLEDIELDVLGGILNSRVVSYLYRSISHNLLLDNNYLGLVPAPSGVFHSKDGHESEIAILSRCCFKLKKAIIARDLIEYGFSRKGFGNSNDSSLALQYSDAILQAELQSSLLSAIEGVAESVIFTLYGISESDKIEMTDVTGTPVGWYPIVRGYEDIPQTDICEIPKEMTVHLQNHENIKQNENELLQIKSRLRALYEAGPGAKVEDTIEEEDTETNDDVDESEALVGKRSPIPTETFLEELSVKMEIHPISIYWLLKEMREKEGLVCWPECKRYIEDYFTVMILRMLGFRWPKQVEAGEAVPEWADKDGIIPITDHSGEKTLFERVRDRIESEFGENRIDAIEQEFSDILYNATCKETEIKGKKPPKKKLSLSEWLDREFFKRHTSQFKKRPIAWHLTSSNGTFQALLFYHRLSGDILKNLKNRYLARVQSYYGVLLERARGGESVSGGLTPGKLQDIEAELEDFAAKLDKVINLPYQPLIDDGVRVNIAPLQKVGLLKHPVLATKDVDRAIADRNRWREDDKEQNTVWRM